MPIDPDLDPETGEPRLTPERLARFGTADFGGMKIVYPTSEKKDALTARARLLPQPARDRVLALIADDRLFDASDLLDGYAPES